MAQGIREMGPLENRCANCVIFVWKQVDPTTSPLKRCNWVLQDLVLQQGVPGGALAQGAQEALQVLLWQETSGGVRFAQEGDLWPLHQAGGCWEESLQRGESNLCLPL